MSTPNTPGLRIRYKCPQCGGPVTLAETDRFFSCGYCKVRLYMSVKGMFRYVLPAIEPPDAETLYVPYLRMRGMYFAMREGGIEGKVLDASLRAAPLDFMPGTLGVRSQALELLPATTAGDSAFLPNEATEKDLLSKAMEGALISDAYSSLSGGPVLYRAFIGETTSMLYYPIRIIGSAIRDCLAQRPMAQYTFPRKDPLAGRDPHQDWSIRFLAARCPKCGWDLEAGGKAVALVCRHCTAVWRVAQGAGEEFVPVKFCSIEDEQAPACYIPFWRLTVEVSGPISAQTYGALARLANLPIVVTPELDAEPLHFWVPAFSCPPTLFLRLSRQLTGSRPRPELITPGVLPPDQGARVYEATLPAEDAGEAVQLIFASMITKKKGVYQQLNDITVSVSSHEFVYIPFGVSAGDFIHRRLGFAIPKNALSR